MEHEFNISNEKIKKFVHFENEVNKFGIQLHKLLVDSFKPFEGKKILINNSNNLSGKYNRPEIDHIKITPYEGGFASPRFYFSVSKYSIWVEFDICFSGGKYEDKTHYCIYHKKSIYLAEVENDVISKIHDCYLSENIHTFEDQKTKIDRFNELVKKLNQLQKEIIFKEKY